MYTLGIERQVFHNFFTFLKGIAYQGNITHRLISPQNLSVKHSFFFKVRQIRHRNLLQVQYNYFNAFPTFLYQQCKTIDLCLKIRFSFGNYFFIGAKSFTLKHSFEVCEHQSLGARSGEYGGYESKSNVNSYNLQLFCQLVTCHIVVFMEGIIFFIGGSFKFFNIVYKYDTVSIPKYSGQNLPN